MPIMSTTATANPTPPKNDIKSIGICLSTNSNIDMSSSSSNSTTLTSSVRNATNATANFYPASASASPAGQYPLPVSLMVAKLPANRSSQTVILQPKINTTRAASLQMNPIRGPAVISPQNLSSSLTSTTSSISVRTRVLSGQPHQNSALPVLNLSAVTTAVSSTNNTAKQVITGQKFIAAPGSVETVNFVMSNPGEMRNRANSNSEIKPNMFTVHNLSKVNGPKPAGSILGVTSSKMIINANTGQSPNFATTRLGILGTANTKPTLMSLPKTFIFTPPNPTISASGPLASMVTLSSSNFVQSGQTTKISVSPNHVVSRHSGTTSNNILTQSKPAIFTVATTTANILTHPNSSSPAHHQPISLCPSVTTAAVSLATSNAILNSSVSSMQSKPVIVSPVKPSVQPTPSSPRPRILSRKRMQNETPITFKSTNGATPLISNAVVTQPPTLLEEHKSQVVACSSLADANVPPKVDHLINSSDNNNITPRKKPRKQLLEPSSPKNKLVNCEYQVKEEPAESQPMKERVILKKPRPSLLSSYNFPTRSLQQFLRYSDVRQKQDKKASLQELIADFKKNSEWQTLLMAEQLKHIQENEELLLTQTEECLRVVEEKISPFSKFAEVNTLYGTHLPNEDELSYVDRQSVKINDMCRAAVQRSRQMVDQLEDCISNIECLVSEHKVKISNMTKKLGHKRGVLK